MHDMPLISTIAAALTAAWILGLITQRLRLSPIVGYLLAGIAIGPYTPGFVGDVAIATQLAELGVILLMFGVGLHFHVKDLLRVGSVAVPGALGQSLVATLLGGAVAVALGWPVKSGLVFGMAMAVASTVVLIRVLTDNGRLETSAGHTAVGWLIVEDILTVVLLVLIPAIASPVAGGADDSHAAVATGGMGSEVARLGTALAVALLKLAVLSAIVLLVGAKVVPWVMVKVARLRSRELFTLTVLVMAIAVASGSAYGFGVSMALGAFLAGMVVGQSPVSQQAAADALPFRDAFSVLFFVSVGMLFDPLSVLHQPVLLLAALGIILIAKPLAAFLIVALIGRPARTALVAALALAQIGEFSFILSDLARRYGLLDGKAHNVLVAGALVSITLNPIIFRLLEPIERFLQRFPRLWNWLNRAQRREGHMNEPAHDVLEHATEPVAVILGYGPSGQAIDAILRQSGLKTVIVDLNMDTVQQLTRQGQAAIFGDGSNVEVMCQALPSATHLIITLPHSVNRAPLIAAAKLINPEIKVFARAHYLREREELAQAGADAACFEEAEIAVALARLVLSDRGADQDAIAQETLRIRQALQAETPHLRPNP